MSLFSDSCGGQNRNQHVAVLLLHVVLSTHLEVIEQKFFEPGHSHMECDSMHSAIESQKKNRAVYGMSGWMEIFQKARSDRNKKSKNKDPYHVTELKFSEMLDLYELSGEMIMNRTINESGKKANWMKMKAIKFEKKYPNTIFYKYEHSEPYQAINIRQGRPKNNPQLKQLYKSVIPISKLKEKDLVSLCKNGTIPEEYNGWYMNLPSMVKKDDVLPDPHISEQSDTE